MTLERSLLLLLYCASYSWVRGIKNGPACLPGHDAEGGILQHFMPLLCSPRPSMGKNVT